MDSKNKSEAAEAKVKADGFRLKAVRWDVFFFYVRGSTYEVVKRVNNLVTVIML